MSNDGDMTTLRRFLAPALSWQTARDALYLLLGLVYGTLWGSLAITLYSVGLGTVIIWIGVGILLLAQVFMRAVGAHERLVARALLGADIPEPEPRETPREAQGAIARFLAWSGTVWRDRHAWRVLTWVGFRFVVASVGFSLAVTYIVLPPSILAGPFVPRAWISDEADLGGWEEWFWLGPVLGIVLFPLVAWAVKGLADAHRTLARCTLGPA